MSSSTETVEVWLIRTDAGAAVSTFADLAALLDPRELRRAESFGSGDERRRYTVAHAAMRLILGRQLGVAPAELRWRIGPHGKPEFDGAGAGAGAGAASAVQLNLSGSGDVAMLALTGSRRVGVDVQSLPAAGAAIRIAERYFPPYEAGYVAAGGPKRAASRFASLWVRKEACVKASGGRLAQGLCLPVLDTGEHVPGGALCQAFSIRGLRSPVGFRAALALEGTEPYHVVRRSWPPV
ncbi:4'-phosphopantetheinyl transferase superfamily protein [Actinocrinis puniceicyclus]|uniref:4'-phosphopantetheinyl transferase superfamily protein n=1 Tax=Actinocrinis puniceicyclus TaxID=977794 RepID=A0A8J8BF57_9ACTN|nr:4'-phosphopantetheinyl transferase superfamily protein [Actinocrinis puniceicyclus]MBS2964419.1 4'-phosphopantetheinyl transferase superfamily protein [Actinocrinis puniceicyclus]